MRCPFCGASDTKVIDSRPSDDDLKIRRRRECIVCAKRFTTYEAIETTPLILVKKNGERELFDREKLLKSMLKACEKRPISAEQLSSICDRVEKNLLNRLEKEIPTQYVGELVMDELKQIDKVSYIRFASVYRDFRDIETFLKAINEIQSE
ncbi:MAG: transcriptional repressor NrdR [Oscillospiraceae bacterium]|nr:transcriptional repressor NrdR [Oscillospiraceae bacterium]